MRAALLALVVVLGGCSEENVAPREDLAAAPADLAAPLTCAETLACMLACTTPACASACDARVTPAGASSWNALRNCADSRCGANNDGGETPCAANPSVTACEACLFQSCASPQAICMAH